MEEEMLSAISHGEVNANVEVSDSCSVMRVTSKRPRHGGNGSSPRFKGVVPLQNGNWGAQIYTNQQRIWLGTFKSESEAAMSYDSAAIKLRNGDCHRNFSWNTITAQEPNFQSHYSTETVLNMIRDGSYRSKFMDFLRGCSEMPKVEVDLNPTRAYKNEGLLCRQLFQKELTPSDVGKLNRLVIPKKYALKYLPAISGEEDDAEDNISRVNDTELVFYDRRMKEWGFRYCYWASSQSYVFTRGWNRFVKEKNLKATDVIAFYVCQNQGGELRLREAETFFLIDVISAPVVDLSNQHADIEVDLQLHLGKDNGFGEDKDVNCAQIKDEDLVGENSRPAVGTRGFKLFGKLII